MYTAQEENSKPTPLGPLPQEWEVVRLGEVVVLNSNFLGGGKNE